MSYTCINPSVYQGDPGNPPEFVSDNDEACGGCMAFVDLDDQPHLKMDDGSVRCEGCREACELCGEWIADYRIRNGEKRPHSHQTHHAVIYLRCTATGKLYPHCIECAVGHWVEES